MAFFGGGFPFGFGGQEGDGDDFGNEQGEFDNTTLYEVLESKKQDTAEVIKQNYQRLVKQHEADKDGDSEKLQQIKQAYETLGDPQKREIYDQYGSHGQSQNQQNIFDMMKGQGHHQGKKQLQKVKAVRAALPLTLQNIYSGELMKIPFNRTRCCQSCEGKGGLNVIKCQTCKGQGVVLQVVMLGPGMMQQIPRHCDSCKGKGDIIQEGNECKDCKGQKVVQKLKTVQLQVEKGIFNNHSIILAGEGHQIPNTLAGDLQFVVQEQPHQVFTRQGADLLIKRQINLLQSLTGFNLRFKHLDGIQYLIKSKQGQIVGDSHKKIVKGLGLPFFKDQTNYGNLIIEFKVTMPKRDQLSSKQIDIISSFLPGNISQRPSDHNYEMLQDFDPQSLNTNEEGGKRGDQEDQENNQGNIGCQSQ